MNSHSNLNSLVRLNKERLTSDRSELEFIADDKRYPVAMRIAALEVLAETFSPSTRQQAEDFSIFCDGIAWVATRKVQKTDSDKVRNEMLALARAAYDAKDLADEITDDWNYNPRVMFSGSIYYPGCY